jgi:Tfp pilus assembly protein PilF/class 3 adenylate cyclase
MGRHLAVLFSDLQRQSHAWLQVPRERMVAAIAEYRYLAEALAGQYGCLYREWAGDGHMFLFESPDAAAQFGLGLIENWQIASRELTALRDAPELPLRLGCHFGECTRLEGEEAWIGRANAVAKRVESQAEPNTFYVTASVLDLIDLPLYSFAEVGAHELRGDFLPQRMLYRLVAFDEQALEQRPEQRLGAEEWFLRGVSMIGTDREWSDDEADCYRKAIELRGDYVEAHVNLAVLLNARRDAAGAGQHYREALRLRPDYPEAHYNYAIFLMARESVAGAAEHLREALRLRPEYVDAHHGYANLLAARGDESRAAEHYDEALRLRPDDAAAHVDYAILLERVGDLDAATHHYQESLRIRPDPAAHYNYALSLETRGEPTLAELHYREALRLWPDYGEAHNNLAILLQLRGDLDEAERHYLAALEARPEDPETHYNYALLLRSRGSADEARLHFRIAYELAPEVLTFRSALDPSG